MITLSDVNLSGGLVWTDRWGSQTVQQSIIRTLGGLPVFYHAKLYKGVSVTLESTEEQGWQVLEVVQALDTLASVAGAQYLLDLNGTQFSVMFNHADGPAFEATPLVARLNHAPGDYFSVKMKFVTV